MASVNKVIILGNVGRDPEVRYTAAGKAICNISVATSRSYGKGEERKEETEWHSIVFYDRQAEIAGEYLKKGRPVYVEGRIRTRKWQDKEGADRYTTEIIAESMQILGGREEQASAPRPAPAPRQAPAQRPAPKSSTGFDDMDDGIPF